MGKTASNMSDTVDSRRVIEYSEKSDTILEGKLDALAQMIRASNGKCVFFTGAGVSTSAGIADYRGPNGKWTKQRIAKLKGMRSRSETQRAELKLLEMEAKKKGKASGGGYGSKVAMKQASPTMAHMAMASLIKRGMARHVVTTNLDGLHHKSGLAHHAELTCLHGDIYVERCTNPACRHEIVRDYHVRSQRKLHVHDHSIGRCSKCGSKPPASYTGRPGPRGDRSGMVTPRMEDVGTKDTHINFGESLDDLDWDEAEAACRDARVCVVVGTSMSLRHITHMPFLARRCAIVNLQKTPDDHKADLRIFADADTVFSRLMELLGVPVDAPPCKQAPTARSKATKRPAVPGAVRSSTSTCKLKMEGAAVGVRVKGREVVKVLPGSQAERQGVQVGWKVTRVGMEKVPLGGQAAADAITKALARAKEAGVPFEICFDRPISLPGGYTMSDPASTSKHLWPVKCSAKGAFGAFSSGLAAGHGNRTNMSQKLLD